MSKNFEAKKVVVSEIEEKIEKAESSSSSSIRR